MRAESDYPSLYVAADRSSRNLQGAHFNLLRGTLIFLLIAGAMSAFPQRSASWWIAAGVINCGVLIAALWGMWAKPQGRWYETRAVAESVKTLSWRYALRARPFDGLDQSARELLAERFAAVLGEHQSIGGDIPPESSPRQISGEMERIRSLSVADRLRVYLERRVDEQGAWYARRALEHRSSLGIFLTLFIVSLAIAAILLFARAADPAQDMPFVDLAVSASMALLAWLQAKRYPETIASYSLTAHEIGMLKLRAGSVHDERTLSDFVGEAENAFSREHTQWIARLDR